MKTLNHSLNPSKRQAYESQLNNPEYIWDAADLWNIEAERILESEKTEQLHARHIWRIECKVQMKARDLAISLLLFGFKKRLIGVSTKSLIS